MSGLLILASFLLFEIVVLAVYSAVSDKRSDIEGGFLFFIGILFILFCAASCFAKGMSINKDETEARFFNKIVTDKEYCITKSLYDFDDKLHKETRCWSVLPIR